MTRRGAPGAPAAGPARSGSAMPGWMSAHPAAARLRPECFLALSVEPLCVVDGGGRVVWCNRAFEEALGARPGGLLGDELASHAHPADRLLRLATADRLAAGGEIADVAVRLRHADGSWRWFDCVLRGDPVLQQTYIAARDVTEAHAGSRAVRNSAARLQALLEHAPAAVFVKDLEGRYLVVNREWSELNGTRPEAVIGRTAAEVWGEEAARVIAAHERDLLERGVITTDEEMSTARRGRRVYLMTRFVLCGSDGAPRAIAGIGTDITERTRAEAALARRERLLSTLLQASPDIISLMDRHGHVVEVTEAEWRMLGHRHERPVDERLFELVHPEDFDRVARVFAQLVAGNVPRVEVRYRVRHADGRWVTVDTRARALVDDHGAFDGAVVVTRDVTAKLEAEDRLRAALAAADQASRAKSEFLSRMSHELRTPLNSVLGFAQLLQLDELPPAHAVAVDHILAAGRHLLTLIDEVLDIARIESGYLELLSEPADLAEEAAAAVDAVRERAGAAGVAVHVVPGAQVPAVRVDRERLRQVLGHLLANAIAYNRPGGRVEVAVSSIGADRVRVSVTDTGWGIAPADLAKVFEPFERLGAEGRGVEGTGVGLALAQRLVTRMGGEIRVESVPGQGSTFSVELPVLGAEEPAWLGAGPQADRRPGALAGDEAGDGEAGMVGGRPHDVPLGAHPQPADATVAAGSGEADAAHRSPGPTEAPAPFRVLLVEDDLPNYRLVERVLARRPGVEVLGAMHGGLALELAREHRPSLVLLDMHLPDLAGPELLRLLRSDPDTAGIPVVVVSGEPDVPEVRRLLRGGVAGYLAKPFDVHALLQLVDTFRPQPAGTTGPPSPGSRPAPAQ